MKSFSVLVVLTLGLLLESHSAARAQWDDGYWFLDFDSGTSSTASPLRVGVDLGDGSGFSFQTLLDHNGDGAIHLPRVPVGGRLALGGTNAGGEVGCDLWDLTSTDTVIVGGTTIQKPLLIVAEDVEEESLGADYGDFTQPPFALTTGAHYSVVDGSIAGWPEPRFVYDFGVPGLEEFVQTVDLLPSFNGEVIVSTATLTGTFVPEPASWLLLLGGAMAIAGRHRLDRRVVRRVTEVCTSLPSRPAAGVRSTPTLLTLWTHPLPSN
jgi:hypothetical protein